MSSADISHLCYIKKYREVFKVFLIKIVAILTMSAKLATLDLLKIKVFWRNGYEVIIYILDVTNEILSRDSNYIVDIVMWLKFGNSSISIREVIIISILSGFDQKSLQQCSKRVKAERREVFKANSYVCRSYRGKTGRGSFCTTSPSWIGLILYIECRKGNFLHLVSLLRKILQIYKAVDIFVYM